MKKKTRKIIGYLLLTVTLLMAFIAICYVFYMTAGFIAVNFFIGFLLWTIALYVSFDLIDK